MIPALLAATLSLGLGGTTSSGLGEGDGLDIAARVDARAWQVEGYWSGSGKLDAAGHASGWLAGASADWLPGSRALLGLRAQHRDGAAWTKDRLFLRAGMRWRGTGWHVEATADSALSSRDRESGLQGRSWVSVAPHLALEMEARAVLYDQGAAAQQRRVGELVALKLWWSPR